MSYPLKSVCRTYGIRHWEIATAKMRGNVEVNGIVIRKYVCVPSF